MDTITEGGQRSIVDDKEIHDLYQHIDVELLFRSKVYGGIPKTEKLIDNYVQAKYGEENQDLAENLKKEVNLEEETEKAWCGFRSNGQGPYLGDYMFKAMLREAASRLDIIKQKRGSRQVFQHDLYIKPPQVLLGKAEVDGWEDFAGHVMGKEGKRSILKRCDYMDKATVRFQIWLLRHNEMKVEPDDLKRCFLLGQELGMGSCRSFESGKFDLMKFEVLD